MNTTEDIICEPCQTKNGFSSADQRSIILVVILTTIALVSCFISVLWYAFRTRTMPEIDTSITTNNNEAFNDEDADYDDYARLIDNRKQSTRRLHFAEQDDRYP